MTTFYRVRCETDTTGCFYRKQDLSEAIADWLYGMDKGEQIVVEAVEMTEKKFNSLPEYEG